MVRDESFTYTHQCPLVVDVMVRRVEDLQYGWRHSPGASVELERIVFLVQLW